MNLVRLLALAALAAETSGGEPWFHGLPLFYFLYALAGAVVLVLLAKLLGHHWLDRSEDYYQD